MALEMLLKKRKINEKELELLLKQIGPKPEEKVYTLGSENIKFGIISDTHIGHSCYDSSLMDFAAEQFRREKVDFVVHAGDICEGHYENRRQGSIFELSEIGGDAQVERAVKELSKIKHPIYAITGNHEQNTFGKISGFDIGKRLVEKMPYFKYLGVQHGTLKLGKYKLQLIHPDGGTAYAISYRTQKIIESLEGGTKPDVLVIGNFHKAEYLFYRNVHAIQAACLERQTPFMRNLGISAHCGFWIVDLNFNDKGVSRIIPQFYPGY